MFKPQSRMVFVAVTLALGLGAGAASARERVRADLSAANDPDARGQLRLLVRQPDNGRLEMRVRNLDPDASFEILVNGVKVGTLTTQRSGRGIVRFRSQPHGRDLTLGFDPRGAAIVLRNAAGADVLLGSLPTATGSTGDTGKVICCVPDDGGSECEDRTPDECTAQGGSVATATSCLPNPCAGAAPIDRDLVCCIPDDSGAECEDRTSDQCAAQGGIVVEAPSCVPNPCAAATPPSSTDTRCCVPDDSGAECELRTPEQCAARGGVDIGAGICSIAACGALPSATPTADDGGGKSGGDTGGKRGNDDPGTTGGTYYGVPIGSH